jgi:hypothetical protein
MDLIEQLQPLTRSLRSAHSTSMTPCRANPATVCLVTSPVKPLTSTGLDCTLPAATVWSRRSGPIAVTDLVTWKPAVWTELAVDVQLLWLIWSPGHLVSGICC